MRRAPCAMPVVRCAAPSAAVCARRAAPRPPVQQFRSLSISSRPAPLAAPLRAASPFALRPQITSNLMRALPIGRLFATEANSEAPPAEKPAAASEAKRAPLKPSGIPQTLKMVQRPKWNQHAHNKVAGIPSKRTNAWRKRKLRMITREEMHRLRKYQDAA